MKPLIARAGAIAEDAQRAASLAASQVERVDAVMSDLSRRVDETAGVLQQALIRPAREGLESVRTWRYMLLKPGERGAAAARERVLVRYDDGAPALVEARRGEGVICSCIPIT